MSWRGVAVQVAGALIGLGLLGWCVSIALREGNREQLRRLGDASGGQIAGMLGLSLASLLFNGVVFWGLIGPASAKRGKRLGLWHVQAVNAVATCLAYVPFKLSVVYRFFVHRVRDGIPIGTIASWLAAAAAALVATCGPVVLVAAVLGGGARALDLVAWSFCGTMCVATLGWAAARSLAGERGLARLRSMAGATRIGLLTTLAGSRAFEHLHAGFDMVGDWRAWGTAIGGRAGDLTVQAVRFWLAGQILGVSIDPGPALLLAVTYFALGAASPSGALGVRESGATGLAALLHLEGSEGYAGVTLLVTAADSIPTVGAALLGLIAVRPWRIRKESASGAHGVN